jgi:hypothetical protein
LYSAVSENYPDPFSTPSEKFYAEVRKKRRPGTITKRVRDQLFINRPAKLVMKTISKIGGVKQCVKIMQSFNMVGRLGNHTFLSD